VDVESSYGLPAATQPAGVTENPIVEARWWTALNDPILDSLVERAVSANLDIKIAQARVREARARWAVAAGGRYPEAGVAAGVSRQRVSQNAAPFNAFNIPGFPWEYNLFQAGFDASWEIDVFGGIRRGIEAAGGDLGASVESRRGVLLSVMAEVARNYVGLRGDQQRLAITQKNLAAQRKTLDLTR
jgi:outer membrane protein TolC